jgi:hypothetical protein
MAKIPDVIEALEGNCGVVSVWLVCHHSNLTVDPQDLIQLCGHTTETGTFTIALAVAFHELNLLVSFHSDVDPAIQEAEISYYERAKQNGIPLNPAQSISEISEAIAAGKRVVAFFDAIDGDGHFSPIHSVDPHVVLFEYSNEPTLSLSEFEARRRANGICRQTIVVG